MTPDYGQKLAASVLPLQVVLGAVWPTQALAVALAAAAAALLLQTAGCFAGLSTMKIGNPPWRSPNLAPAGVTRPVELLQV